MTASTLLSLNFNDQSIVDNTGKWEVLNDGSDVLGFALVGDSTNYSLVVDHFANESPAVLGIINPTDYATEYTIDFDMYVKWSWSPCRWALGFKNASATDATILIYLENGEQVSGSIYKYDVCFQHRTNSYTSSWSTYAITSDKPVRSSEWAKIRITALKNADTGYYEFKIYVNGVLKASDTTTYPITTTLENQLTIGGPDGTAYLLCGDSVTPTECSCDTGCALDNLIITRGEVPLRSSVVSLAGLQQNNANLLSYVHSKLATVATTGSYDDLTDKPVIPPGAEFASEAEVTDTVLSEMNYLL